MEADSPSKSTFIVVDVTLGRIFDNDDTDTDDTDDTDADADADDDNIDF